jgi:hypothetical protein
MNHEETVLLYPLPMPFSVTTARRFEKSIRKRSANSAALSLDLPVFSPDGRNARENFRK